MKAQVKCLLHGTVMFKARRSRAALTPAGDEIMFNVNEPCACVMPNGGACQNTEDAPIS